MFTHIHGKRYALFLILNTAMVTHLMMVLTYSYWFTILVRFLFSITNQSQNLCLELLLNKAQNDKDREKLQRNYSILSGSGYILGPIISGYLFDCGFGYIGVLAALLALTNVSLLMKVTRGDKDVNPEHADKSVLEKASRKVVESVQYFQKCQPKKHWDILLLRYLFAGSVIIFFSKFTQILKYNYHASSITMGYTGAYINAAVFVATYYIAIAKSTTQKYPMAIVTEISFLSIGILMLLACYAPYYELYMLLLLPVIVLRSFIITLWKDLFSERKDEFLVKLNSSVGILAGLTIPLLFGTLCNQIAHNAVILFSCAPMFVCWAILKWRSRFLKLDEDVATDDKKDS